MPSVQMAFVRAINLGKSKRVAMADLRGIAIGAGFSDVRTILNTGNLVYRGDLPAAHAEAVLERALEKQLGLVTDVMVRTPAQWRRIMAANPFGDHARRDPAHMVLMVCKKAPGTSLTVTGAKRELVKARGREIYIVYPDGIGESRLTLNARGTARNWNTVLKIAAAADALRAFAGEAGALGSSRPARRGL